MREIKFRGFDKISQKITDIKYINFENGQITSNGKDISQLDFELMQYTGLKDKNGVEIYEGDIVRVGNYVYKVIIDIAKGLFFECIEHLSLRGVDIYYTEFIKGVNIEAIGNIYENKNLLE